MKTSMPATSSLNSTKIMMVTLLLKNSTLELLSGESKTSILLNSWILLVLMRRDSLSVNSKRLSLEVSVVTSISAPDALDTLTLLAKKPTDKLLLRP